MLSLPPHTEMLETSSFKMAFDEAGILYAVTRKGGCLTLQEARHAALEARYFPGNRKVGVPAGATHCADLTRAAWNTTVETFAKQIKAAAIVCDSPLDKLMARLLFTSHARPYPVQLFNDEPAARQRGEKHLG